MPGAGTKGSRTEAQTFREHGVEGADGKQGDRSGLPGEEGTSAGLDGLLVTLALFHGSASSSTPRY